MTTVMKNGYARTIYRIPENIDDIRNGRGTAFYDLDKSCCDGWSKCSTDIMHFGGQIAQISSSIHFIIGKCQEYDRFLAQGLLWFEREPKGILSQNSKNEEDPEMFISGSSRFL